MLKLRLLAIISMSLLLVFVFACNKGSSEGEVAETGQHVHEPGEQAGHTHEAGEQAEHTQEKGEHAEGAEHEGEGEETGPRMSKDETFEEVRKGVKLILSFDNESSSFIGTVENVAEETLSKVRVEVHLNNGVELGPTEPIDLEPGKKAEVKLSAEGQLFSWWKAHAEVGASEHT